MSDIRRPGISTAVIGFSFGDSDDEFLELWGPGVGMPSILASIPRDAENFQDNGSRSFARRLVGLRVREIAHDLIEYLLLNCRAVGRCFTGSNELVQKDSEQGRCRKVERRLAICDGHNSVSVVGLDNCNEERALTESQGPVGACPPKSQGE